MDNYDYEVVMHASMLEDGMVLRTTSGQEYAIRTHEIAPNLLRVEVPFGSITFHTDSPDNAFLTSFEVDWQWMDSAESWDAYLEAEAHAEMLAEARNERFWEEGPHGGTYAGSEEEARDRWMDSLYH